MNILITGGTGFIGRAVSRALLDRKHHVTVLTRDEQRAEKLTQDVEFIESLDKLTASADVVINLAGESLGSARWTRQTKAAFIASRVDTTASLINYIERAQPKPKVLLSGSAVGFYGACGDVVLDENAPAGDEYQSELCRAWELEALKAYTHGVRVCLLRMGLVLARHGGTLPGMLPAFKLGLGGHLGNGKQWISWVHIDDLVQSIGYLIGHPTLFGPFNITAPYPQTNKAFANELSNALDKTAPFRIPAWAVRIRYGEMARLFLTGQRVIPKNLLNADFQFSHPTLKDALREILKY